MCKTLFFNIRLYRILASDSLASLIFTIRQIINGVKEFCEKSWRSWLATISVRYSERNCADRSSRGGVIQSNSAAAQRFWLSTRNRRGPPRAARNRTRNGMELRGDVPFANLLIPTREITAGRRRKRVFRETGRQLYSLRYLLLLYRVSYSSIVALEFILP